MAANGTADREFKSLRAADDACTQTDSSGNRLSLRAYTVSLCSCICIYDACEIAVANSTESFT